MDYDPNAVIYVDSSYGLGGIGSPVELYAFTTHCARTSRTKPTMLGYSERHRSEDIQLMTNCMYLFVRRVGLKCKAKGDYITYEKSVCFIHTEYNTDYCAAGL